MATGGKGHAHEFDPISGWCTKCNYRRDGRLISPGGDVWHEGSDSDEHTEERTSA